MPSVLVATDADWLAGECRSALDGDHDVLRVRRGAEVIEAIRAADPRVVLLDLQIGSMGGVATCMAVRQEEDMGRLGHRPILLLLDRPADEFLARRCSADAWLVKPINSLRLARAVSALV